MLYVILAMLVVAAVFAAQFCIDRAQANLAAGPKLPAGLLRCMRMTSCAVLDLHTDDDRTRYVTLLPRATRTADGKTLDGSNVGMVTLPLRGPGASRVARLLADCADAGERVDVAVELSCFADGSPAIGAVTVSPTGTPSRRAATIDTAPTEPFTALV